MRFKREYDGDVVILSPGSNLWGGDETEELAREIDRQLHAGCQKLVIDLYRTANMATRAIGMFQGAYDRIEAAGAAWAFCNVDRKIEHPLVVMKLVRFFNVCETRAEAVSFLNQQVADA